MINRFLSEAFGRLPVLAASTESPEKQRRTIETSSQSKVHESGDVHTNANAPAKAQGGNESEKGKDARVHRTLLPVWRTRSHEE